MSLGVRERRLLAAMRARLRLATVALIAGCLAMLAFGAYAIGGAPALALVAIAGAISLMVSDAFAPAMRFRAERVSLVPSEPRSPGQTLLCTLAKRAALRETPVLLTSRLSSVNAFASVDRTMTTVCVTESLLRRLDARELAGVLAHEVGHIKAHDLRLLAVTDAVRRLSVFVAILGALLLIALPDGDALLWHAPGVTMAVLLSIPFAISLMQLSLARAREFDADLAAVGLTGDPGGLVSALSRLDGAGGGCVWPGPWDAPPRGIRAADGGGPRSGRAAALREQNVLNELGRTHPTTAERVRRIEKLLDRAGH